MLIKRGVWSVMTGHLAAPKLAAHFGASGDEKNFPATLSHTLTTKLLRDHLGFDGVIVTDAFEMRAITERYGPDEAAPLTIEAGTDVLLMPLDPVPTYNTLINAVKSGRISSDDVEERVHRIHRLKEKTRIDIFEIAPGTISGICAGTLAACKRDCS